MKQKRFCPFCQHELSTKFLEGYNRLYCSECRSPVYENPVPATAAVSFNDNQEVLLVKRNVDPGKGEWCLPGGFVELEETPESCCLRELKEETSLVGQIHRLMGVYLSGNPVYKSVLVIGFLMKNVKGTMKAGDDSDDARYFPLDRLPVIAFQSHRSLISDAFHYWSANRANPVDGRETGRFGAYVISSQNHLEIIEAACRAGARIVQYRDKKADTRELLETARKIREITRKYRSLFMVNDHLDIALLSEADGVHLGQDDLHVREARKIVPPGFIIGISTHSLEQAESARDAGADYIAIGPVFPTPTKETYPPVGLETVKQVVGAVSIPVVAIGGLNLRNIADLASMGVENVAMVREFQYNTGQVVKEINRRFGLKQSFAI